MQILFYNSFSLRVGSGPEHWLMDVSHRLEKLNNNVTVVAPTCSSKDERFSYKEVEERLGKVTYEEFSCLKLPKLSSSPLPTNLLKTFSKKADVLYFLNGFALQDIFVTLDKMLTRTPVICGLHGPLITTYGLHNLYVSQIFRRNLRLFDACHALNLSYVELMRGWGIKNVYLIPNGVDTDKFHPLKRVNKGDKFKVLFIGRFAFEKGVDVLCKAIDLLNRDKSFLDNIEFTLVGRGPMVSIVQQATARYRNVKMVNFIAEENLVNVYSNHHLFVLPARFETFPLPTLEAQACGLPIITSNISGTREQVSKEGGSIIESGDYSALTEMIKKYYSIWKNEGTLYERLSFSARKNVLENFELDKVVLRINDMLSEVAQQKKLELSA